MDCKKLHTESEEEYIYRVCHNKGDKTWEEIGEILNGELNYEYTSSKYRKSYQSYCRLAEALSKGVGVVGERPILVFGDTHLPFHKKGYLEFLKQTHAKYNCREDIVICVGDMLDLHGISFHTPDPNAPTAIDEFDLAKEEVAKIAEAFPNLVWLLGNHDNRIVRKVKEFQISQRFIKTFHELLNLPSTWKIQDELIFEDVVYRHQGQSGGKNGHLLSAQYNGMSVVCGHLHSNGGVSYFTNPQFKSIFGMNTGSLCDDSSLAMNYSFNSKSKSTLGCGLVYNSSHAQFVPYQ